MVIGTLTWLECGRWRDTLAADQTDEHFDQHVYEGYVYEDDVYDDHNGVDDAFDNDNVNVDDTIAIAWHDTLAGDQTDEYFDQDVYDDHNGLDDDANNAFDNDNVNADDTIAIAGQDTLAGVRRVF